MKITTLGVVKFVVSGVVGIGTGKIVGKVIRDHITPETLIEKVTVTAAAWAISGIVTTATKKYTNETVDQVAEAITTIVGTVKTSQKLNRINKGESTFEQEELNQEDFQKGENDQWVPKAKPEIDIELVRSLLISGEWKFNPETSLWTTTDGKKSFRQTNKGWFWVE